MRAVDVGTIYDGNLGEGARNDGREAGSTKGSVNSECQWVILGLRMIRTRSS
jgi:hypothetical protein